jgi:hypothetical protein
LAFTSRFAHKPGRAALAALAVFVLALGARLVWVSLVDSPYDNISSDMAGYINRALQVAYGDSAPLPHPIAHPDIHYFAASRAGVDPWTANCPFYPPGAHMVYAAEMKLVGWSHHGAFLLLNCMWGAVVAPCALLLAVRIVPRLSVALVVGVVAALWYPLLAFSGYFSSEQPYAGALALSTWLLVRLVEQGKGAVATGAASGIAYLVRPQIVLTLFALAVVGGILLLRRRSRRLRLPVGRIVVAGAILTATVGWGALRYHRLSGGRWGLISDNGAVGRLGADTNYSRVRGVWRAPDGTPMSYLFESPTKAELGEHRELTFDGYVGDPAVIDRARRNEVHYMSAGDRIVRWLGNVRLLFDRGSLWPTSDHQGNGWRKTSYEVTHAILMVVLCPLTILGLVATARRPRVVTVVCAAQVLTMLIVAAFFCGEQRYRVPYDVFLLLLSLEGARWCVAMARATVARLRYQLLA